MIVLRQDVHILDAATTIPATGVHTTPMSLIKTTRQSSAQTGKISPVGCCHDNSMTFMQAVTLDAM